MAEPHWLSDREQRLWRTWLRVNQELPRLLEELIHQDSGLSGPDYAVLVPLSESPDGRLRARELRHEILWDRSRLAHHLGRMEYRGLITREACADDRRGAMVQMTSAGRAAIEQAAPGHAAATRRYFIDLLDKDEVDTLTTILDRVLTNLDERP